MYEHFFLYVIAAVAALFLLFVRFRLSGALLGLLIGQIFCYVRGMDAGDAAIVNAVCVAAGFLLAGILRRRTPSGGDEDFFGECCTTFRRLAETEFGIATEGWTDAGTLSLGRAFTDFMVSSPEPSRILRKSEFSECITWALSTPLLAGFLAARTGRLEYGLAQEKDGPARTAAVQKLQAAIRTDPHKFFFALFLAFVRLMSGKDSGGGVLGLAMRNGMRICDGMRAAFQLGAAMEMGRAEEEKKALAKKKEE